MAILMQRRPRQKITLFPAAFAAVLLSATSNGLVGAAEYGTDPQPVLELENPRAGETSEHRFLFSMHAGELETYRVVITYPAGFEFVGFDRLGPEHTRVGALELDLDANGTPDVQVDIRSGGPYLAYADLIADGEFSPGLEPRIAVEPPGLVVIYLPMGGDARESTTVIQASAEATIRLSANLIINPSTEGTYPVSTRLTSVDPDTDGFDDGLEPNPREIDASVAVEILPAGPEQFEHTRIRRALLRHGRPGRDSFYIKGSYAPGNNSDGVDPQTEGVTVVFGPFTGHVNGARLRRRGNRLVHSGRSGLRLIELHDDGAFVIATRALDLSGLDASQPVNFELRIGDDAGVVRIPFSAAGVYPP